jgi:DeoR family transcriptional regulator, aga operon transcriptional repressor
VAQTLATAERRRRLLALVRARGFLSITGLGEHFGVSTVTIRNDLDGLAERGYVVRVRGGAIPSSSSTESAFEAREAIATDAKLRIAEAAVDMLRPGDTVILDVGTTTMAIAHALVTRGHLENLVVVTNGLNIALALESLIPHIEVMLTGGLLRPLQHSLVEPRAVGLLKEIRADYAFIGCDGVHPIRGITTSNFPEAIMKQAMLQASHQRVIVADSSKLLREAVINVASLNEVDVVLTAGEVQSDVLTAFQDAPIEVQFVPPVSLGVGSDVDRVTKATANE